MQTPRPAVVSQTFPGTQHALLGCGSQISNSGEKIDKRLIITHDGFHLGLLQHDFADPNAIGIGGVPPWQIPGCLGKPAQ